jgi:hypothetical protein
VPKIKSVEIKFDEDASSSDVQATIRAVQGSFATVVKRQALKAILGADGQPLTILTGKSDAEVLNYALRGKDADLLRVLKAVVIERASALSSWEQKFATDLATFQERGSFRGFSWRQRKTAREILKKVLGP